MRRSALIGLVLIAAALVASFWIFSLRDSRVDDASLVSILEGRGDPRALEAAAKLYRARKAQGLTPQNALKDKFTDAQAAAVLHAFEPESLRLGLVIPVFAWFDRTSKMTSEEARMALAEFIKLPLGLHEEIALLDMGSRSARRVALLRAKATGRPELLAAIQERLNTMPLQDRAEAIEVLPNKGRSLSSPIQSVAE